MKFAFYVQKFFQAPLFVGFQHFQCLPCMGGNQHKQRSDDGNEERLQICASCHLLFKLSSKSGRGVSWPASTAGLLTFASCLTFLAAVFLIVQTLVSLRLP